MVHTTSLAAGEEVPGRPFTRLERTLADLETLERMRAAVRRRLRAGRGAGMWQANGDRHWLVAPDPGLLLEGKPVAAVGFFGQARGDVDHQPIVRLEHELLGRAPSFPALVSYHNVRFASGQWGNLVTFLDERGAGEVRSDSTHLEAVARTAVHYHSVRLHRLRLADGPCGPARPELVETLLLDFDCSPPWRGLRPAPGAV